jgi:hypothetical protein
MGYQQPLQQQYQQDQQYEQYQQDQPVQQQNMILGPITSRLGPWSLALDDACSGADPGFKHRGGEVEEDVKHKKYQFINI